jgi:diguanylate cyclase (GGDEF)-like protein
MGLMFIDLDNFKHVNDNHGHDAGDEVLRVVARRMSAVLRRGDLLCRLGGDEFALLLPELQHVAVAEQMAQRLISSVREPLVVGGVLMPVGATVGLAFFPTDAQDADGLLQAADAAMYAAKRAGKNCYRRVAHAQG